MNYRVSIAGLVFSLGCGAAPSSVDGEVSFHDAGADAPELLDAAGPTCGVCSEVRGVEAVEALCPEQRVLWNGLVGCLCHGPCLTACTGNGQWCDELGAASYPAPGLTCRFCAEDACERPLLACGGF